MIHIDTYYLFDIETFTEFGGLDSKNKSTMNHNINYLQLFRYGAVSQNTSFKPVMT